VRGASPLSSALTPTAKAPSPAATSGVRDPYAVVVPYSKWYVVASPATPPTLASTRTLVARTGDTPSVRAKGSPPARVVRVSSAPALVPSAFVATRR
jgi:hypothetical protein